MISFDLRCRHAHLFEAWFRSSDDYAAQLSRGLISCPTCGDSAITKAVMAPNVAAKGNRAQPATAVAVAPAASAGPVATVPPALPPELAAALAKVAAIQAEALPRSRWVGPRFAEEARALHEAQSDAGDGAAAGELIHGQATPAEAEAMLADGIGIVPLLVPFVPPDAQN